ncbi:hypothetical protein FHETE_5325 [Fusarium heterosporum]|uniref:EKC/KEOPS complex subunit BUD32 n=1 Tax=Fusarium heterosporum TaxID=42747 RepID=A0A8H5WSF0_FUSHE|nr:hypothetical protein FHETE_5325 [Fusarium heterosporum]
MAPIERSADLERLRFYDMAAPPRRLGRGRHAIVFECHDPSHRVYAMKLYKPDSQTRTNREIEVLQYLRSCPNIVQLADIVQGDEGASIGIILEHVNNIDYRSLYPQFGDMDIRYYTCELLKALEFAHGQGVMHRDLRPQNVVIDHQHRKLRLIGWSSAEFYEPGKDFNLCVGHFKSPELLLCYERYDYSIDMWSFGAMLVSMIFRKEPFFHGNSCIDQLLAAARVLGTESLHRFVAEFEIQMDQEDIGILRNHPRQPWREFVSSENQHLATEEAIDLVDRLVKFNPRTSRLHYLVPANAANLQVCAVVASALVNRYSIPMILGYKGESFLDAQKAHIAKLRAIRDYLHDSGGTSDDLVIIVDGFDVMAQLPAEAMIQRYFTLMVDADQRLADQRGITINELHRTGVRQTVLWGTDKGCWPESETDPRCWLVPFSTQPRFKWGLKTDTGDLQYSDSRFLNSGTVIGPLGDLRKFIDAALILIEDDWNQDFLFRDSDQFYIAALYARQEYQRMVDLNGGDFPEEISGRTLPKQKTGEKDVTEYHITVDFDYAFTQTECHNYRFIRQLQYDNFDLTTTVKEDTLEEGSSFNPYTIQMPSLVYQALHRVYDSLSAEDQPAMTGRNWIRSLKLGTNIGTRIIFAFYHNTCDKTGFVDTFHDAWFYPLIRPLLRVAVKAIEHRETINAEPLDGRMWMAAREYPKRSDLRDEYGGVYTDAPEEGFVPLQRFCSEDLESVIGRDVDYPLSRP